MPPHHTKLRIVESSTSTSSLNTSLNSNSTSPISATSNIILQQKSQHQVNHNQMIKSLFSIGELVWGSVRGYPAWPGKILNPPDGMMTTSDSAWVKWFGRKPNIELVSVKDLKSLSEGLDAHHKAQKDIRK